MLILTLQRIFKNPTGHRLKICSLDPPPFFFLLCTLYKIEWYGQYINTIANMDGLISEYYSNAQLDNLILDLQPEGCDVLLMILRLIRLNTLHSWCTM